jgi:transcriptional regulator with XRE-family HTH domain
MAGRRNLSLEAPLWMRLHYAVMTALPKGSPNGDVLAILRIVRGWNQRTLAVAAQMRPATLSNFERGEKPLPTPTLERLLAVMGLPSALLARTLAFLDEARSAPPPADSVAEEIEAAAAAFGKASADLYRRGLTLFTAQGTALAERSLGRGLWERLQRYGAAERRAIVRENPEFWSWGLCELLCDESVKAAADDAAKALDLADLAVLVAGLVPGPEGGPPRLRGWAWAFLGNARRVHGNLVAADEAFARSRELWEAGASGDSGLLDESRLLDLEASLRRDQRRLHDALALLDRALVIGGGKGAGHVLVIRAKTLEEMGDYEGAVATLRLADPLIDGEKDPRLRWCQQFNLLENLCQTGRIAEASPRLLDLRELTVRRGNKLDLVHLRWLEGRVAAGLGQVDEAVSAFHEVRATLVEKGIAYDTALVSLELAVLLAKQGRSGEVKSLARLMAPIFQAQGVHREALSAIALFRRAAEQEAVSVELARDILEFLRRSQHDPELRFERREEAVP